MEKSSELESSLHLIEQQKQALAQLSKLAVLGDMTSSIAHEINTPLGIISLHLESLLEGVEEQEKDLSSFKDGLIAIQNTLARIAKIVEGMRRFSRDTRNDPLTSVSIKQSIDDAIAFCSEKFRHNNVVLSTKYSSENLSAKCRPVEISQVILNLLNNAFDAVKPLKEKWVNIFVEELPDEIEISVIDSGGGVSVENRGKIFQPFFTTKEIGRGGLGLSISKGIIDSSGGTLSYDASAANTKFVVRLKKSV